MFVKVLIVVVALVALASQVQAYRAATDYRSSTRSHAKSQKHRQDSNSLMQPLFGWGSMDGDLFFPSMSVMSQVEDVMNMMDSIGAYSARQPSRSSSREGGCSEGGKMITGLCMQMHDSEHAYEYSVELPGCKKEDVKLKIVGEDLHLEAERSVRPRHRHSETSDSPQQDDKSSKQKIARVFTLPEDASRLNIEAEMQDGVLTLVVPKVKPTEPPVINVLIK